MYPRGMSLAFDPIDAARERWAAEGWGTAADGMAAVTSVMRAKQLLSARVEAVLKPLGITFARYETLMLLRFSRRGSLPMSVISARLQVHASSVTNAVDRLESAALVTRVPHPEDRRTTLVTLTPAGRRLTDEATVALNDEVFTALGLGERDLTTLTRVLTRLRADAGDF